MIRSAGGVLAAMAVVATMTGAGGRVLSAQSSAPRPAATGQVIGSRSFSPMVEDVDAAAAFYVRLGLTVPPAPSGVYPWDTEEWHFLLHGGQAPRSQMRFMYGTVPGAVPPATPLLIEPVEHRNAERRSHVLRVEDPGTTTLVLLVRDLDVAAKRLPEASRQIVRRAPEYGAGARAMTIAIPGAHLVELVQADPQPPTTAPPAENVIGARLRVTVDDLDRTLGLYRDQFGLSFVASTPASADFGGLKAAGARLRMATAILPSTSLPLEFLEVKGVDRHRLAARIQDPGAARLQLTVQSLDTTLRMLKAAGPSTVASSGGEIITQPNYRVVVASDLNGLFLVLTDRRSAAPAQPAAR